jgi:hypothetical protein
MLILQSNPNEALISFTIQENRFVSVLQGKMMLTADPPMDVVSDLAVNTNPARLSRPANGIFEFAAAGGPPVQLTFAVLPKEQYAAVGLFVRRTSADPDGGGVWDNVIVGNGFNDNVVYVRNKGRPSHLPPATYEVYMLVRRRDAGEDYPTGDIGVIDPVWINR